MKGKKINQNTLACPAVASGMHRAHLKVGRLQVEEKKGEREIWCTEMNWRVVG